MSALHVVVTKRVVSSPQLQHRGRPSGPSRSCAPTSCLTNGPSWTLLASGRCSRRPASAGALPRPRRHSRRAEPRRGAPLLCAGVTTFNALRRSLALPGDVVAVRGLGGLGHLGVQAERCAIRTYTDICNYNVGKDHRTYDLALAILNEEVEHEAWFSEFLGEGPVRPLPPRRPRRLAVRPA